MCVWKGWGGGVTVADWDGALMQAERGMDHRRTRKKNVRACKDKREEGKKTSKSKGRKGVGWKLKDKREEGNNRQEQERRM